MPRRGENIYKRKDGRYEGRYQKGRRPCGKVWWGYVYSREYAEVKKTLAAKKVQAARAGVARHCTPHGATLNGWLVFWLETLVEPYVKPATAATYRRAVEKHMKPYFKNRKLCDIGPEELQGFVDSLAQKLAPSTVHGVCRILRTALREAVKHGTLPATPYVGIREPKKVRKKPRVLTRLEQRKVEATAEKEQCLEYFLFLYTALRLGELCALRWEDFDFGEGTVHIRRTVQRIPLENGARRTGLAFGPPKSEAGDRVVPLPRFVLKKLRARLGQSGAVTDGFVFPGQRGGCVDPRTLQKRFAGLCKGLGIRGAHIHTLRHSYAARCREQGIGYEVIAELMGHSSPAITIQFYGGCTFEHKRENVQRLEYVA